MAVSLRGDRPRSARHGDRELSKRALHVAQWGAGNSRVQTGTRPHCLAVHVYAGACTHKPAMSALPPKADIDGSPSHVRFVPFATTVRCNNLVKLSPHLDRCPFARSFVCSIARFPAESTRGWPNWSGRGGVEPPQPGLCTSYWPACDFMAASICALTASRLKLAPFCIGGKSIAVWASCATRCCTNTKRQNSKANQL